MSERRVSDPTANTAISRVMREEREKHRLRRREAERKRREQASRNAREESNM